MTEQQPHPEHDVSGEIEEAEPWESWETWLCAGSVLLGVAGLVILGIIVNLFFL